ncbi:MULTISPECIES: DUF2605 family protein [Aphanothece]|uniref:DUF2605 family protein n=1 Tax=Aphanothece TaxID=1121 RepID=UPI003984E7F7
MSPSPSPQEPAADLLEHLLGSLLADFRVWFSRGELLLDLCPDSVMGAEQRQALRESLAEASRQLAAATSLRRAVPVPMALGMDSLAPWHQLVMRVWSLSACLRRSGVDLPPMDWPALPSMPGGMLSPDPRLDPPGREDGPGPGPS